MLHFPAASRRRPILAIALPIVGGMASQIVLNLVDSAMVGQLGSTALAASGIGSFANFMAIAIILGLATGVQSMASRRVGEGRENEAAVPLDGGLLLAIVFGLPLCLLMVWLAPWIFSVLTSDEAVEVLAIDYFQVRVVAMIGVGMNFAFRGFWSTVDLTRLYLMTLLIMHVINIVLNWVLIFGNLGVEPMGVYGAGLATTISIYIGTAIYLVLGLIHARPYGFLRALPSRQTMLTMLRVSLPSSIQQLFFAAGMTALLWIVGLIGTNELAAATVLLNLMLVGLLPAMGFGIAGASLVGKALGREDPADARLWGWNVTTLTILIVTLIAIPSMLFYRPILGLFLEDPVALQIAIIPYFISVTLIWLDAAGLIVINAHLGAGDSGTVMRISVICQWCLFLPLAWYLVAVEGQGFLLVWAMQVGYRVLQALWFMWSWHRGHWQHIKV